MLHAIPTDQHGAFAKPMTHAIEACVHCGFCLAACPTYRELGQEMDTPRGRIVLMKQVLEGALSWQAAQPHIDRCLGCLACEPACPSGVPYRDLITPFRALAETKARRSAGQKLRRFMVSHILPYPARLRVAARLGRVAQALPNAMPRPLRPMLELLPTLLPKPERWPSVVPARGTRRARVGLLLGCAQQVLEPDINSATISVLSLNGIEVVIPKNQGCCGGLAWHTGELRCAQGFARQNLNAFPHDLDAIVSNAAGCGSTMREYALVLRGAADEEKARSFAQRVVDVSRFLTQIGLRETPYGFGKPVQIAYHDACHLANAQNVRAGPRSILRAIPGVELCEIAESELCCGSAGSYNIDQPEIARALGAKKAQAVMATGAQLLATGNIGCLMQLRTHLTKLGSPLPVRHTMQILRDSY
jgi:glycolate oxidase iron-sulfur subunit